MILPAIVLASLLALGQPTPAQEAGTREAALELALAAAGSGAPERAVALYRAVLSADPQDLDARVGLAAVFYRTGQFDAAAYHWGLALQHDLPADLRYRLVELRNAARLAERLDTSFSLGLAQNDNVNAAPRAETIDVLGLPFRLNEQSRARQMQGLEGAVGLHYRLPLSGRSALRQSTAVAGRLFPDDAFNDYLLSTETAYDYLSPEFEVQAAALTRVRWLGSAPFSYEAGGALKATRPVTPHLDLTGALYAGHRWHEQRHELDRDILDLGLSAGWSATETLRLGAFGAVRRESARTAPNSFGAVTAGLTATATLAHNIRLETQASLTHRAYDAPSAFDTADRHDLEFGASARATFGNLSAYGFAPYAGIAYSRTFSTNAIHRSDQTRISFGLTKIY